ncbi:MAG: rhodanese-like domain-containing protein [Chitinophagales bacterium]|nr:rhodanese-like domain-containing protein [Chitinophagales bacterium]
MFKNLFGGAKDLSQIITDKTFLVDVRTPSEFAEGTVKGAVNIPLDVLTSNLDKFKNKENIVVFCRSGNRSGQAKSLLDRNNIPNVTNGGTWVNVAQFVK